MRLELKRGTQEQIEEIFKTVSYHSTPIKRVFNANQVNEHPLIDSLLAAHWKNQDEREDAMAETCEHLAKKASNSCAVVINE